MIACLIENEHEIAESLFLDRIDLRLLSLVQQDGRATNADGRREFVLLWREATPEPLDGGTPVRTAIVDGCAPAREAIVDEYAPARSPMRSARSACR